MKPRTLTIAAALALAPFTGCYYASIPSTPTPQEVCTKESYGIFPLTSHSNTTCENVVPPTGAAPTPAGAAPAPPQ
ncbi:MAG TPA: hypothetical protein VIX59_03170 [Candidatus Binataceae bacterium]